MAFSEQKTSNIIASHERIEEALLNFLKIIPFENQNFHVYCPSLVNILLDCCSIIDSIFRETVTSVELKKRNKKRKKLTMSDFKAMYKNKFSLKTLRSLIYVSPSELLMPFDAWNINQSPIWWKDHNKIKHDRFKNPHLATLKSTVIAVCGLFELISQHPWMNEAIIRHGWLDPVSYNIDYALELLDGRNKTPITFLVETTLFATTRGPRIFPRDHKQIMPINYYGARNRLSRFLVKSF